MGRMAKKHSSPVDSFDWMHKKSNSEIEEYACEWTRSHCDHYSDTDEQIRQKAGLDSRSLHITLYKGTVQLIRSLLSTVLVRVDVQSNHQNQNNNNRYTEDRYHHYYSFQFSHHYMWTRIPQSHTPKHTRLPHAFHHTPWAFYSLSIIILIHVY